jgi:hypothetical protein
MDVNMQNFTVFRTAVGIIGPHQRTQILGGDAWPTTHEFENARFDGRKRNISRHDRVPAVRADLIRCHVTSSIWMSLAFARMMRLPSRVWISIS